MPGSTKRWLKAAVVTFGVVDCIGIYIAHDRLSRPALPDGGSDMAYAVPAPDSALKSDRPAELGAAPPPVATSAQAAAAEPAAAPAPQFALAAPAFAPARAAPAADLSAVREVRAAADASGGPTSLAGLVAQRAPAPLFAAAFESAFADVPLDAPITATLPEAGAHEALAEADGAEAVELAQSGSAAPDSGAPEIGAESLPEAGPAAILPDSDVG